MVNQQIKLSLEDIIGKWYIIKSNFPMWLKGDKTSPTFNYSLITKNGKIQLLDVVKYMKNGKEKSIIGYDKFLDDTHTKFEWRGKGILFLLKSLWNIVYIDVEKGWAIIEFKKTLVSPAGYDVITREPDISDELKNIISYKLEELNLSDELKDVSQS